MSITNKSEVLSFKNYQLMVLMKVYF